MEKLLKLLRKFEEEVYVDWKQLYDRWLEWDYICCRDKLHKERGFTIREGEAIMISDWYGFIKWLFEKGKIKNPELYPSYQTIIMFAVVNDDPMIYLTKIIK